MSSNHPAHAILRSEYGALKMDPMQLPEFIERHRKAKGLSKMDIQRATRMSYTAIFKWGKGTKPRTQNVEKLARALRLTDVEQQELYAIVLAPSGEAPAHPAPPLRVAESTAPTKRELRTRLDELLTATIVRGHHLTDDARAILDTMAQASERVLALPEERRRAVAKEWLDAAAQLRVRGETPTAALIAATAAELRGDVQRAATEEATEEVAAEQAQERPAKRVRAR